jgi:hypothetical protein
VLPTLRGKPEVVGKQALPNWMMHKDVEKEDQSVAGWMQRIKNAAFGGLQADIFDVSLGVCQLHWLDTLANQHLQEWVPGHA